MAKKKTVARKRPTTRKKAVKKILVRGKVDTKDERIFTVGKSARSEEKVVLDFGRKVEYQVVKLSIRGLPRRAPDGKPITWINNFAVIGTNKKALKRVRYTVYLRGRTNKTFVYYDQRGLHFNKKPQRQAKKNLPKSWVKVVFNTGDPAHGWM